LSHPTRLTQHMTGNQAVGALPHPNAEGCEAVPVASAPTSFAHDFSRIPVHANAPVRLQTKLTVNTPGDIYEQEAERVSEQVTRIPESKLQRTCPCGGGCPRCQSEQLGSGQERLQINRAHSSVEGETAVPPIVHEVLRSSGQPLDSATRAFMEPRLGHEFSRVRVHTDTRAAESAQAVNALAYTVGQNLVFNQGQYAPGTLGGKRLLAHELTHVAQQSGVPQREGRVQRQAPGSGSAPSSPPRSATVFHPGVNHDHRPSGRWADVQANPNSSFWANRACANFSPNEVVGIAMYTEFSDKPLGLNHLSWYLVMGGGADLVEDVNLDGLLRIDTGVQALLGGLIPSTVPASGRFTGHVKVEQSDYQDQDFRYSFGAIDRLDFEVDFRAGTVHAWLQDRYEWHPVYPGLYTAKPGDVARETNCVHAAMVELKTGGARDFWMKGEATVPLSLFRGGTPPPHPHPGGAGGMSGSTL